MDTAAKPSAVQPQNASPTEIGSIITGEKKVNPNPDPKGEPRKPTRAPDPKFKIFSGAANEPLAQEICAFLGIPLGQTKLTKFSDGEIYVQILENVRGGDIFLVQPTCHPVDHHLMQLLKN